MTITINPAIVKQFGTKVKSGTERYVLPLNNLDKPLKFENPKDAGTKYGEQNLKGDGNDIMLLNGLTPEQVKKLDDYCANFEAEKGKPAEKMNTQEVEGFLDFLAKNEFNDRYCSTLKYQSENLIPTTGRMHRRNGDECRAVVIPVGTVYEDGEKSQQATVEGALFIVDAKGGARITNVPSDYQSVTAGEKIATYADATSKQAQTLSAITGMNR